MSEVDLPRLELPHALRARLRAYRRRVWSVKLTECGLGALCGLLAGFLLLFAFDRLWDTPASLRWAMLAAIAAGFALLPVALYRWVWRRRHDAELARLVARRRPRIGDRLLGVIELVASRAEQERSRALCSAAIRQVADEAEGWNLAEALPPARRRLFGGLAAGGAASALVLYVFAAGAAHNAWARLLTPWRDVPRFTFVAVEPLAARIIVAHGEPFAVTARLRGESRWRPARGSARLGGQRPVEASIGDERYEFALPPAIDEATLEVSIGDWRQSVRIEPVQRPELTAVSAEVTLPAYLERTGTIRRDVRGGAIGLVAGSRAAFAAVANRPLRAAWVDGEARPPAGATILCAPIDAAEDRTLSIRWEDENGLSGREPFEIRVSRREDEAPAVSCEGLAQGKVLLDSDQLLFQVAARDDFGVRRVGIEWQRISDAPAPEPSAGGERILAAGGPERESFDVTGTFCPRALGIEPQPLSVRVFAEDYFPGRARVYTFPIVLYVLDAEQHALWITAELDKWHRQALEVRDRELELFETNKQLRGLEPSELDRPDTRKRIAAQSEAERANARRLSQLAAQGSELLRQAARNSEFGVGHLERWAEMLQALKEIAERRMPEVASSLAAASKAPPAGAGAQATSSGKASDAQASNAETPPSGKQPETGSTASMPGGAQAQAAAPGANSPPAPAPAGKPAGDSEQIEGLTPPRGGGSFPVTAVSGEPGAGEDSGACPAVERLTRAVEEQEALLAEFAKLNEELGRILARLEGSTFVRRLQAAARDQYEIGGGIIALVEDAFGTGPRARPEAVSDSVEALSARELECCKRATSIVDDMEAYLERRRLPLVRAVVDEMRAKDVLGGLRQIAADLPSEAGLSIAYTEFWSDAFERWARGLVEAASGGA
ncbi:MAG: hypothetical protein L0Z55_13035 [Planctomycetes bacterium]|nr:hypothetical protein [Planctomycetota bacterium]